MLVVTRKMDDRLVIGNDIVVTIVRIDGNKVRLGVSAPADVVIAREELFDQSNGRGATQKLVEQFSQGGRND